MITQWMKKLFLLLNGNVSGSYYNIVDLLVLVELAD